MEKYIFVYSTVSNVEEARKIASHLLRRKLAACANFFPIESMYLWDSKIKTEPEIALILKTTAKNFSLLKKEIIKVHSYQTPCIAKIDVDLNTVYARWLKKNLSFGEQ